MNKVYLNSTVNYATEHRARLTVPDINVTYGIEVLHFIKDQVLKTIPVVILIPVQFQKDIYSNSEPANCYAVNPKNLSAVIHQTTPAFDCITYPNFF
ncbi:MAG: hypothetical protein ABIN97_13275 [Ginsengibacter sp.]